MAYGYNTVDEVKELREKIKLDPCGIYLFWGEEEYLKRFYLGEFRKIVKNEGMEEFNLIALQFDRDDTVDDLVSALMTPPVMARHKMIEVFGADIVGLKKDEEKKLLEALADFPPDTILVIYARFDELDLKAKAIKDRKIITEIKKLATVTQFPKQTEAKLLSWTDKQFESEGIRISDINIRKLIALCDFSMIRMKSECDKLISYCKFNAKPTVEGEYIDMLVSPSAENEMYELCDAVLKQDCKKAVSVLENLFSQNTEPIVIVGAIIRSIVSLTLMKSCERKRLSSDEVAKISGFFPWQVTKLYDVVSRRTKEGLKKSSHELMLCDEKLKGNFRDNELLVTKTVVALCRESYL